MLLVMEDVNMEITESLLKTVLTTTTIIIISGTTALMGTSRR
jgi:hypothetical protein